MALDPKDPLIPLPWQMDDIRNYREQKKAKLEAEIIDRQIKQLDLQKKLLESPEAQIQRAGELAERSLQAEQDLASQQGLFERLGTRAENVRAAATPLPAGSAGPVMPEDLAISTGQKLLEDQDLVRAKMARMGGEIEAIRKQREGLQGSVNLGEFYGTAPAGDTNSVAKRRYQETTKLIGDLDADIKNSSTPEEAAAKTAAGNLIKPWFNLQTRRELENTLKVPGLNGLARDEKAAVDMRSRTAEMVNTMTGINSLLALADEADRITKSSLEGNLKGIELARIKQRADLIRTPLVAALRVPVTGGGPMTDSERAFLLDAIRNPTDFINVFARDRLQEMSRIVKKDFVGRARIAGYEVNNLQQVFDAYSDPEDLETAGPRLASDFVKLKNWDQGVGEPRQSAPRREQIAPTLATYPNEAAARAAGKKDYDYININGRILQLLPD
jgi:hypothetical protein